MNRTNESRELLEYRNLNPVLDKSAIVGGGGARVAKVPTTKPDNLNLLPSSHVVGAKKRLQKASYLLISTCADTCACETQTHVHM